MKAPNGKPTNLTEKQWAQVRTKAFKKWFGDWEFAAKPVNVVRLMDRIGFKNFKEAREWAKGHIVGNVTNPEIGEVSISGTAIDKYLSGKAVGKSVSINDHLTVLQILPKLIEKAIVGETHADREGDLNIKDIVRLYGAVNIDGNVERVKITVKRYADKSNKTKAYSYEVKEIESLEGTLETTHTQGADFVPTSNNSITAAKLLQNVESDKT